MSGGTMPAEGTTAKTSDSSADAEEQRMKERMLKKKLLEKQKRRESKGDSGGEGVRVEVDASENPEVNSKKRNNNGERSDANGKKKEDGRNVASKPSDKSEKDSRSRSESPPRRGGKGEQEGDAGARGGQQQRGGGGQQGSTRSSRRNRARRRRRRAAARQAQQQQAGAVGPPMRDNRFYGREDFHRGGGGPPPPHYYGPPRGGPDGGRWERGGGPNRHGYGRGYGEEVYWRGHRHRRDDPWGGGGPDDRGRGGGDRYRSGPGGRDRGRSRSRSYSRGSSRSASSSSSRSSYSSRSRSSSYSSYDSRSPSRGRERSGRRQGRSRSRSYSGSRSRSRSYSRSRSPSKSRSRSKSPQAGTEKRSRGPEEKGLAESKDGSRSRSYSGSGDDIHSRRNDSLASSEKPKEEGNTAEGKAERDAKNRRSLSKSRSQSRDRSRERKRRKRDRREDERRGRHRSRSEGEEGAARSSEEKDDGNRDAKKEEDNSPLTKDRRTVFVSQLVMRADERDIRRYFRRKAACRVNDVILLRDKRTGRHKGCAYVELGRLDDVAKAVEASGKVPDFQRFPILVKASEAEKNYTDATQQPTSVLDVTTAKATAGAIAASFSSSTVGGVAPLAPGEKRIEAQKVYVGSIDRNVTQAQLYALFSQFGQLDKVLLQIDAATGTSRGFAFLSFRDPKAANLAIQTMQGQMLAGRGLKTGWANQQSVMPGIEEVKSDEFPEDSSTRIQNAHVALTNLTGAGLVTMPPVGMAAQQQVQMTFPSTAATAGTVPQSGAFPQTMQPSVATAQIASAALDAAFGGAPTPSIDAGAAPTASHEVDPKKVGRADRPTTNILVHNMYNAEEETDDGWEDDIRLDFEEECAKYGTIRSVVVMSKEPGGKIFASFNSADDAKACAENLAGRWFDKRQLRVEFVDSIPTTSTSSTKA